LAALAAHSDARLASPSGPHAAALREFASLPPSSSALSTSAALRDSLACVRSVLASAREPVSAAPNASVRRLAAEHRRDSDARAASASSAASELRGLRGRRFLPPRVRVPSP
jgi:hypothetical protein